MEQKRHPILACVLLVMLSLSSVLTGYPTKGISVPAEAATVTKYYIYLDDRGFEVTREQYNDLYERQGDPIALLEYLRSILGNRMPESFREISGRIVTGDITPKPDDQTALSNDFIIQSGELVRYLGKDKIVTLPSNVTAVRAGAFYGNSSVKAVILPKTVKRVENYAFYNCAALKYIVFSAGTGSLGDTILYGCDKLTNFVAPKGSKAYSYAQKKDIPVTTGQKTQFAKSRVYLLQGDSEKNTVLNTVYAAKWKSSKKKIASVSSSGKIKAKKAGKATITATVNGKKISCKVTVMKKTINQRVNQVIKSVIQKDMSKYQKVKAVHNWLIKNVKYDYYRYLEGRVPSVSHTAKGALLKKTAVCDGYAHAFDMIMKKLKIKSKFVAGRAGGGGHAWNMVKLGGKWYHVDTTFDDPVVNNSNKNTKPYYTYFLKSSSVMKKSHSWKKSRYPKCTSRKYD